MVSDEIPLPVRKTPNLCKGRLSFPSARYFVTCRAVDVGAGLHLPPVADGILSALDFLQQDGDIHRLCSTVMPDHVHLLIELGERLTVSQIVGKFKALSRRMGNAAVAASGAPTMRWQRNFFEHRLRPGEPANDYARYIFMNPYRAGLIGPRAVWPLWRCEPASQFDFLEMLDEGCFPPPVWFATETDGQLLPAGVDGNL